MSKGCATATADFAPRVLTAGADRSPSALAARLRQGRLLEEVWRWGAVLLRGYDVRSARDFEAATAHAPGLRAMTGHLLLEPGRERLDGTRSVFCTNRLRRTGGGLSFTGLHCENYYSPEVPVFMGFCCLTPPWLGGETMLTHMGRAYAELDSEIREAVEARSFFVSAVPVRWVADSHGVSSATVERLAKEAGLPVVDAGGTRVLVVHKPSVIEHPHTGAPSLQVNLSAEVPGFDAALLPLLAPRYTGRRWAAHRLAWRSPRVARLLGLADRALADPRGIPRRLRDAVRRRDADDGGAADGPPEFGPTIASALSDPTALRRLARAVWRHSTAVAWRRGDVLLFDNLQVLHAGLPGFGPRALGVQMYNPVTLHAPRAGRHTVPSTAGSRSMGERLGDAA